MEGIFKKPNQLINIDRSKLSRISIEIMDTLLEVAQDFIYKKKTYEDATYLDLVDHVYEVHFDKILDGRGRNSTKFMIDHVNEMASANIKSIDTKYGMYIKNIFQDYGYKPYEDVYEFKLSNDVTKSFYYNTNVIGKEDSKPYYTKIDTKKRNTLNLPTESSFHLVEHILQYQGLTKKKGSFDKLYEVDVFKNLIGISEDSYPNISDFKSKVIKKIIKELHKNNYHIDIQVVGLKGKKKYIKVIFYDKNSSLSLKED